MSENTDRSVLGWGSVAAFLAGALLFVAAVSYLFWPPELMYTGTVDFFRVLLKSEFLFRFTYLAFMLSALFSLGVVPAVAELVPAGRRGLARWVSLLAILGFSVTALNFLYHPSQTVRQAQAFRDQQGAYQGVGVYIYPSQDGQVLMAPYAQSPAAAAGLLVGDELLAINGQPVSVAMPVVEISQKLRAEPALVLRVRTPGQAERDVQLQRGLVTYWNVDVQEAMQAIGVPTLDGDYLFSFGLVGIWFLVINSLALRGGWLSKVLAGIGLAAGLAYWAFVAGFWFDLGIFTTIAKVAGFTLGPLWFLWMGLVLRRTAVSGLAH